MECNKEEAIRARDEAEKKMQKKEFDSARKLALRAERLYPNLENISQLLLVCNVHCSTEQKLVGNEMDWYGILQVEQTADDATIKKQYRKLALQLHPDKNRFAGAEAAFKLIGEAQRVLLDNNLRRVHDMKRKVPAFGRPTAPCRQPQNPAWYSTVDIRNNVQSNFSGMNHQHQPVRPGHNNVQNNVQSNFMNRHHYQTPRAAQQESSNGRSTFWTQCSFCHTRYEYYRALVNKLLNCQKCRKGFTATDFGQAQASNQRSQPAHTQQNDVPVQAASKGGMNFQGKSGNEKCRAESSQKTFNDSQASSRKVKNKRRKGGDESSENDDIDDSSSDSGDDMDVDEDGNLQAPRDFGINGEHPRRSTRQRKKVSYNENISDDDEAVSSPKRAKMGEHSKKEGGEVLRQEKAEKCKQSATAAGVKGCEGIRNKGNPTDEESFPGRTREAKEMKENEASVEDCSQDSLEADNELAAENIDYPDPDFSDFHMTRREECFAPGQIWAVYDPTDGMPRLYAEITKVWSRGFKLRMTWLDADPEEENLKRWVNEGLPLSCGKFKRADSQVTEKRLMFSHLMPWKEGNLENAYMIYPRKGETWALFRNWNFSWIGSPVAKYEYEFVEILSDYADDVGVYAAYMGRVKGFECLYFQMKKDGKVSHLIPPSELLRFSHRIPSFKMTGEESDGVPKGSFELDPASIFNGLERIFVDDNLEMEPGNVNPDTSSSALRSERQAKVKSSATDFVDDDSCGIGASHSASQASKTQRIECPEPEFYNFESKKSVENFRVGDIWSLYCDEDGLPKYYGQIKKVKTHPNVSLQITWLEARRLQRGLIRWRHKEIPVSCGNFKINKGSLQSYSSTDSFSHWVDGAVVGKNDVVDVFPRKGEIWALYRDWNPNMTVSELENSEYDVFKVQEEHDSCIEVMALERVKGHNSVFKPQVNGGSAVILKIPCGEVFRFSHQLPAFQLNDEGGGKLRGYWELDPAALPLKFFS